MNANQNEDKNKYGLSRYIKEPIKRQIRRQAGFGCVVCGSAFYDYEHFDPEFKDAKEHNPLGITLLCPSCHASKTRGRMSKAALLSAVANPRCLQVGYSRGPLEFGLTEAAIQIGSTIFYSPKNIITVDGDPIFKIEKPEHEGGPLRLTFIQSDDPSESRIIRNEWFGSSNSGDITTKSNEIIVRDSNRKVKLHLENILGDRLVVKEINAHYKGINIRTDLIKRRIFGNKVVARQKYVRAINQEGIEILRFAGNDRKCNEIRWENALRIMDGYMSPDLIGMHLKNGDLHYIVRNQAKISVQRCTFEGGSASIGSYSPEVKRFIEMTNQVTAIQNLISNRIRHDFLNMYRMLEHQLYLDQLSNEDRMFVKKLYLDLR